MHQDLVLCLHTSAELNPNHPMKKLDTIPDGTAIAHNLNPNFMDCNWTRAQNHVVLKQTLNHLPKLTIWSSVR